jgi:hypothetical protein
MRANGRWIFNVPIERERCAIERQTIAVCNAQSSGGPMSPMWVTEQSAVSPRRILIRRQTADVGGTGAATGPALED